MRTKASSSTPIATLLLAIGTLVGTPLALFVVFTQWADSWQRQLAAAIGIGALVTLSILRRKVEALFLALLFCCQFEISLISFHLSPPVIFQVLFSDLLIALFALASLESSTRIRVDWLAKALLLMIIWHMISAITASAHRAQSLIFTYWEFKYLIVYIAISSIEISPGLARKVAATVAAILFIQGSWAIAQLILGRPLGLVVFGEQDASRLFFVAGGLRVSGSLGATNAFAGYMAMLLVLLAPFVIGNAAKPRSVGFALGFAGLISALSRAGWLSFLIGAALAAVQLLKSKLVRWPRIAVLAVAALLAIAAAFSIYAERIRDRFEDSGAVASAMGRFYQFEAAWPIIREYPLMGIGGGVTEFFGAWNEKQNFVRQQLPGINLGNQPHNSLLQYTIEGGVIGGGLLFVIFALVAWRSLMLPKQSIADADLRVLQLGAAASCLAFLVHSLFGTEINHHQSMLTFFLLAGIVSALSSRRTVKG